jgi:ribonuclease P/MRP protein subunit POP1
MAEDNTPTVTARKRKPSGHQRLRLELAKKALAKTSKNPKMKKLITGVIEPREANIKKNTLQKPDKPKAKFRKRQIFKAWLPTHLFHAKRAHMTPPKEPLWRMSIPLAPTQKCYRPTHRASTLRGAVAWDMSYMSTISVEGQEQSICGVLKALGVGKEEGPLFWQKTSARWMKGTRSWQGWLYERDGWPEQSIAPVTVIWCPAAQDILNTEAIAVDDAGKSERIMKRQILIRVHPSAFLQLWQELIRMSKVQKPGVVVTDLRFEIGSIDLVGPASAEVLGGTLRPKHKDGSDHKESIGAEEVWSVLHHVSSPGNLPINAILTLNISDPRLYKPVKAEASTSDIEAQDALLNVLTSWPIDSSIASSDLFSRANRLTAQRQMPSQKAINRRKSLAEPGENPESKATDPSIPIIVLPTRGENGISGSWTIVLPWKCVLPVWYSLLYYPISTGGTIRFGGLEQKRQIAFESGTSWFPGDYPGTKAGDAWEVKDAERRRKEWEKRPKGKRVEYESIVLDKERKGEVGKGWACEWARLTKKDDDGDQDMKQEVKLHRVPTAMAKRAIAFARSEKSLTTPARPGGLITVSLTSIQRGAPTACARIYRLPTTDSALLQSWLSLLEGTKTRKKQDKKSYPSRPPHDAPAHEIRRHLAESLLVDGMEKTTQAGDAEYPAVPEEQDLIGFVTTGNYNLGGGRGTAVGCLLLQKVLQPVDANVCIVREAGQALGRLARWELTG